MPRAKETCATCRFCEDGLCHRYPPSWSVWPLPSAPAFNGTLACIPPVAATDWCGEWQEMPR